ncbi:MAG: hypothetical protein V4726_17925 [Verrucomicrobiota bacterium]
MNPFRLKTALISRPLRTRPALASALMLGGILATAAVENCPALVVTFEDPDTGSASLHDGWSGMTRAGGYTGYTAAQWPAPITSNLPESSGAELNRIGPGAIPASSSIYGYGTFEVGAGAVLPDLETVVLQFEIGEGQWSGQRLDFSVLPALSFNGGSQAIAPAVSLQLSETLLGNFGPDQIIINHWLFQWDLSEIRAAVTDFSLKYSVVDHTQQYAMRMDQGNSFVAVTVPEPSAGMLLAGTLLPMISRRKRGTRNPLLKPSGTRRGGGRFR